MAKNTGKKENAVIKSKKQRNFSMGKKKATPASWKPGQSGNPKGRPLKGYSLTEMLKTMIDEKPNIRRDLMQKILDIALKTGDLTALGKIWSYLDGMPKQPIDLNPPDTEEVDKLKSIVTDLANVIKKRRNLSGPKTAKPIQT